MENYDILLNEIKDYLKKEEVNGENFKNEIISAYDLYNIITTELSGLKKLTVNSKLEKLFKIFIMKYPFYRGRSFFFEMESNCSRITLYFSSYSHLTDYVSLKKDINSNNICLEKGIWMPEKKVLKFVEKYYDLFLDIFMKYEKYREIIDNCDISSWEKIEFTDNIFKIEMRYDVCGQVNLNIKINDNHPLSSEYQKNYLKKENIPDFVEKHKDEILKRFVVSSLQLTDGYKKIYNIYKNNLSEKGKVKSIKR